MRPKVLRVTVRVPLAFKQVGPACTNCGRRTAVKNQSSSDQIVKVGQVSSGLGRGTPGDASVGNVADQLRSTSVRCAQL